MNKRAPTEVDKAIGRKVRIARRRSKLSQSKLGESIGVTYQQVQKYENGTDRVGAARVFQIAAFTDHPIAYFFTFDKEVAATAQPIRKDALADDGMQRLLAAVTKIKSPGLIKNLTEVARTFASNPEA